jgi:hypothetical protein
VKWGFFIRRPSDRREPARAAGFGREVHSIRVTPPTVWLGTVSFMRRRGADPASCESPRSHLREKPPCPAR